MPSIHSLTRAQLRFSCSPCRSHARTERLHLLTRPHRQIFRTKTFDPSSTIPTIDPHRSLSLSGANGVRLRNISPAMTSSTQTRHHAGHSHSHHHNSTYLTSSNRKDAGVRITRIGLYVNVGMAVGKGIGGYYLNSQALVADAFHALTDLVSDIMTLATVSLSLKPPTARFPSGYGKIESLGSLGVSGLLLVGGLLMGLNACEVLYYQFFVDAAAAAGHSHSGIFGHSHSHGSSGLGPNINAAWLAAGSIVVKEYLYQASKVSLTSMAFQC